LALAIVRRRRQMMKSRLLASDVGRCRVLLQSWPAVVVVCVCARKRRRRRMSRWHVSGAGDGRRSAAARRPHHQMAAGVGAQDERRRLA
jgi:hypothetical protein